MKNILKIFSGIVISWLLISGVSAMWHWNWYWKNKMWKNHNEKNMIDNIEKQDLSDIEIDLLQKQYEEEMMANELYTSFYEMYGIETFKNIASSEAQHMKAVKSLFDRYELELPTNYDHIQDLYEQLKSDWSKSASQALEVWVKIEFVDIDDIVTAIKATDNDDVKIVLTNIGWASYNHLRGFLKAIDNNGYETELDYTSYLSDEDLVTKWPIKYKLIEKLESDSKKEQYKISIEKKYNSVIDRIKADTKKTQIILVKIDDLVEKTKNSSTLTEDKKISKVALLEALRELLESN